MYNVRKHFLYSNFIDFNFFFFYACKFNNSETTVAHHHMCSGRNHRGNWEGGLLEPLMSSYVCTNCIFFFFFFNSRLGPHLPELTCKLVQYLLGEGNCILFDKEKIHFDNISLPNSRENWFRSYVCFFFSYFLSYLSSSMR